MPELKIETGIEQLDADLRELFALSDSGRLGELSSTCATLSDAEFQESVPDGLLRIVAALANASEFETLLAQLPGSESVLKQAKQVTDALGAPLLSHPLAPRRIVAFKQAAASSSTEPLASSLHVIRSIQHVYTWFGTPPKLVPGVRIAFVNKRHDLLLDTSLDWDDLLFVIDGLLRIAAGSMRDARVLAEQQQLELGDRAKLGRRIATCQESLSEIVELASSCGIQASVTPATGEPPSAGAGR